MNCAAQPVRGEAQPLSIKADRNSCRTNGRRPASAFHSAASTAASESTTLTDSKFDADPFGDLRMEQASAPTAPCRGHFTYDGWNPEDGHEEDRSHCEAIQTRWGA